MPNEPMCSNGQHIHLGKNPRCQCQMTGINLQPAYYFVHVDVVLCVLAESESIAREKAQHITAYKMLDTSVFHSATVTDSQATKPAAIRQP